jgi:membrane-associated phospholipid phosphatase
MLSQFIRGGRGALALTLAALLGACQEPTSIARPQIETSAQAAKFWENGATVGWNKVGQDMVVKYGTSAPATIRLFALLSVAQYNAIVAAEKATSGPVSNRGAVAGASAAVLSYIYPQESSFFEQLVDAQSSMPEKSGKERRDFEGAEAIGRTVAAEIVARAQTDRFFEPFTGTVPVCPGCWVAVPTPPAFATLGQAKPFFLATNDQFRPAPPPAFGSPEFLAQLAEVRQIADTRTAEQDSIAKYWALGAGTVSAQGYWNVILSDLAVRYRLTEREAAHRFAVMNMAAFDVIIASHEAKYHYWLIRPKQVDNGIQLAIGMPSFPAYPSNHSALAGAAAAVLGEFFPAERRWLEPHAEEGAMSRVYGGIHYRFDSEAGLELGRKVAGWVMALDVVGHEPFELD